MSSPLASSPDRTSARPLSAAASPEGDGPFVKGSRASIALRNPTRSRARSADSNHTRPSAT